MHDASMHGSVGGGTSTVLDSATESKHPGAAEMMDEITTLKQRIRELEEADGNKNNLHDDTQSFPSVDSTDTTTNQEVLSLRTQVGRLENEKATMELDFMNQLASIARGHEEELVRVKSKLTTIEQENQMATKVTITGNTIEATELLKQQSEAMKQLKRDLASADKELAITRRDMNGMTSKVSEADSIKSSLLQEITDLRLQLEQSSREKDALNDNILDVEKHYSSKFMEMEDELAERQMMDENREHELAEMNDCIIKLEGEKEMLLEEVTDLRLQLQKTHQTNQELKKEVHEWRSGEGASSPTAKVTSLEKEKEELSNELASLRSSLKTSKEQYEETISSQTVELDATKQEVEVAVSELTEANLTISSMKEQEATLKSTLEKVRTEAADKERHIAALETQRVNYAQRTSTCIMDHVVEADEAKDQVEALKKEIALLKKQLEQEKQRSSSSPLAGLRPVSSRPLASNSWGATRNRALSPLGAGSASSTPRPQGVLSPPSTPRRSLPSAAVTSATPKSTTSAASPSGRSVLALASQFEKKTDTTAPSAAVRRFSNPTVKSSSPPVLEVRTTRSPSPTSEQQDYAALKSELDQKTAYVSALERRFEEELTRKTAEIKELRSNLQMSKDDNVQLTSQLQTKQSELVELQKEMVTLKSTKNVLERSSQHGGVKSVVASSAASAKELQRLQSQNKSDTAEIERLMSQLEETCAHLNEERRHVVELQEGIKKLTDEKVSYQVKNQNTYESEALRKETTKELDQLKMQLTQELVEKTRLAAAHKSQLDELEATIEELNRECDAELEEQQKELEEAQSKLKEATAELERMRTEKEQLCVSMNGVQNDRKDDFDSLHAEMMEKTAQNANLAREIQALKMKVEEKEECSQELEGLRKRVLELEEQGQTSLFGPPPSSITSSSGNNTKEVEDLTRENQRLRESVRKAAIEKRAMQEKVNSIVTDQGQSTSIKVLRERNAALKKEVERLSSKLRKYVKPKVTRVEL
mmetsp:Transcript_21233/g.31521  ORF Transcript_21233/g.31521 Transcript_21233/m.31521 type:complete len:994 (-) Transcript_21233:173-3154(-)|eukprot:CAMPEP_0194049702 /NCGR_PEP_ID=MMETSP0009_2-20130614/30843_1 /TAXON_ID=210454 /ORGANISM="Grammatophora oceanica, Strain CCMP 410" /LENGTH=993 /DNA_ID=CAMNT_0038695917 /DNA_START=271 /DNA_END=3252 /DNA_ORIENTATION=+